jgi:hypothetical protein
LTKAFSSGPSVSPESVTPEPGIYFAEHCSSGPLLTLFRYRELLRQLVIREVKLRYKRSVLGFAWTVLNPLFAMAMFTMVFSRIFGDRPNYRLYVITALLGWNLFSLGTSRGLDSVVMNGSIIRKVMSQGDLSGRVRGFPGRQLRLLAGSLFLCVPLGWDRPEPPLAAYSVIQPRLLRPGHCYSWTFNVFSGREVLLQAGVLAQTYPQILFPLSKGGESFPRRPKANPLFPHQGSKL